MRLSMAHMRSDILDKIRNTVKKRFLDQQRLFSFEDFTLQASQEPRRYLRNTVDWVCDAFKHFDAQSPNSEFLAD